MKARVFVTLKPGVLDPQGKAIGHALESLGFGGVAEVRAGKVIELELSETDPARAKAQADPAPYFAGAQVLIDRGEYDRAIGLTGNVAEKTYLARRRDETR